MRRLRYALAAIGMLAFGLAAHGQTPAVPPSTACRAHAPEAAVRSAVAVQVILRVTRAESSGRRNAVSRKGARRFGLPGAYAAYNAGPGRYIRYAANGVPLTGETVAYATRLGGAAAPAIAAIPQVRWQEARLFLHRASKASDAPVLPRPDASAISATTSGSGSALPDDRISCTTV